MDLSNLAHPPRHTSTHQKPLHKNHKPIFQPPTLEELRDKGLKLVKSNGHRLWEEGEDLILKEMYYQDGASLKEIALRLNRTRKAVDGRIDYLGLPRRSKHYTQSEDAFLKKNYGLMTPLEISEKLGRTYCSVICRASSLKITGVFIGERRYNAKHSDQDVELCRQLYDEGITPSVISEKMEIPLPTVYDYLRYEMRLCQTPVIRKQLNKKD